MTGLVLRTFSILFLFLLFRWQIFFYIYEPATKGLTALSYTMGLQKAEKSPNFVRRRPRTRSQSEADIEGGENTEASQVISFLFISYVTI